LSSTPHGNIRTRGSLPCGLSGHRRPVMNARVAYWRRPIPEADSLTQQDTRRTRDLNPPRRGGPSRAVLAGLACALIIGTALRLHRIGAESLWLDEAFSVDLAHSTLSRLFIETAKDVHPPLYYLALHYWVRIAGDSETAVRLLSAIASVGVIGVLFTLASRLFGYATGLSAALLAAIAPFQIEFAQEARMYALLSLLSLMSLSTFVALVERGRLASFLGYVAATALMLYTHAYGVFVLLAEALALVVIVASRAPDLRRFAKPCALAQACAVLLFLPWLPVLLRQIFQVQRGFWIPERPPGSILETITLYSGSVPLAWLLSALAAIGLVAVVLRRAESSGPRRLTLPVLGLWLMCPLIVPLAISQISEPIFLPKYTIVASLAFTVLAARAVAIAPGRVGRIGIAALIAWASWTPLHEYYGTTRKVAWRDAVAGIDRAARAGDLMFFNQPYAEIPFDYYSRRSDLVKIPFLKDHDDLTAFTLKSLIMLEARGHNRVWLVLSNPDQLSPLMVQRLSSAYDVAAHTVQPGLEIYRFETPVTQR
jgi:hypothetical protein